MADVKEKQVCLKTVRSMGFTDSLIRDLLPEPRLVENPRGRRFSKMKLWKKKDVDNAMLSETFIATQKKREKRVAGAKKAVQTKTDKLMNEVEKQVANIKVTVIESEELEKKTIEAKQNWYNRIESRYWYIEDYCYSPPAAMADKETLTRWKVNYIRHNLTSYDDELLSLYGRTGKGKAYLKLFGEVMNKIAEAYPSLAEECKNQVESKKLSYCG